MTVITYIRLEIALVSRVRITFQACGTKLEVEARVASPPTMAVASILSPAPPRAPERPRAARPAGCPVPAHRAVPGRGGRSAGRATAAPPGRRAAPARCPPTQKIGRASCRERV